MASDSESESDFASAESDTEDLLPRETVDSKPKDEHAMSCGPEGGDGGVKSEGDEGGGGGVKSEGDEGGDGGVKSEGDEGGDGGVKSEGDEGVKSEGDEGVKSEGDEGGGGGVKSEGDDGGVKSEEDEGGSGVKSEGGEEGNHEGDVLVTEDSGSTEPCDAIPPVFTPPISDKPSTGVTTAENEPENPALSSQNETEDSSSTPVAQGGGENSGWGGWGGWGGSLWSSVSTVAESAQAIGQKVTAVIASVEDSLGVPAPQELAQERTEEQTMDKDVCKLADDIKEHDISPDDDVEPILDEPHMGHEATCEHSPSHAHDNQHIGAVSGFLSGFAAAVQTTSHGLVSGGLDALETIGKKTMEVLSEGDPGLAKKRALLGVGPAPTLSQLLKEAKSEQAGPVVRDGELDSISNPLNYSRLFDEYHGVGHLEALELLSKECAGKIHSTCGHLSGGEVKSLQEKLAKLSEYFTIEEDQENLEDDSSQLEEVKQLFSDITLPLKVDKLTKVSSSWREKVVTVCASGGEEVGGDSKEEGPGESAAVGGAPDKALYENGLRSLAEMTSTAIELFRKMAEVSLLPDLPRSDPLQQAQRFNRLTVLVSNELDALASVYSEAITELDLEGTNANVTSLYLESSNSGSYVQDAFQLLLPVLKFSLVQQLKVAEPLPNVLSRN